MTLKLYEAKNSEGEYWVAAQDDMEAIGLLVEYGVLDLYCLWETAKGDAIGYNLHDAEGLKVGSLWKMFLARTTSGIFAEHRTDQLALLVPLASEVNHMPQKAF